ncbi:MAG: DNA polymerase I, partial [Gammaproteobacteria bacterium]
DRERLRELFRRLEFRSWLRELEEGEEGEPQAAGDDASSTVVDRDGYRTILDEQALEDWVARLEAAELFAFDTETTDLDYMRARVVGMSFAVAPGEAAYLPLGHDYPGAPGQLDLDTVLERLRPLLEDPQQAKLGHHLKYDRNVLANHGITLRGIRHDTMLESYMYDSSARQHDLDSLCQRYLDHCNIKYEEVAGKGAKQIPFNQVALEQATPYAAEDADLCLRLHAHLWPLLAEREGPRRVYEEIEIPLIPVLSDMERTGVLIDTGLLARISQELAERMAELESKAHELAGEPFNLGSTKQLRHILFEKLGLPALKKTPKGEPSTAEEVLAQLAEEYELPQVILDWRSLSKLKSTYTDKLPQMVNPDTGRVHTSYHQAVAATGRLSSSDPNLQNIPIRTREGRRIREAFIAPEGRVILAADYSQIELRIMAHLSGDEGLLKAFAEGRDIHRATAAEVFGVPEDLVTDEQRRAAKAINFGLIYGMSAFGLARQIGVDRTTAQEYIDLYFARYPGVRRYMDETREKARSQGYVETLFGRRLYLPEIRSRNAQRRQYAERTAINAPMQGTAADIIKRAMNDLHGWIGSGYGDRLAMIMQVHDELVFEIDADFVDEARGEIERRMSHAAELRVPLEVGIGVGANWEEAH